MFQRFLNPNRWRWLVAAGLASSLLLAQDPQGQQPFPEQPDQQEQQEPDDPSRGVARVSLIQGDVSVKRGDSGEWVAAAPNAPLVVQDSVVTGGGASRAEVQFDYANLLRLAPNAEVRLAELEYRRYMLQLAAGTISFRVLRDSDADVEISTPSVSVRPVKKGIYRISLHPDGTTEITVRSGEAEINTPRGTERLKSGRTMLVRGTAADPEFQLTAAPSPDEFDTWGERRDRDLERSISYRYVSPSVYGAEDLDGNGSWTYDAPYGWVWAPTVSAGWAPYRNGRWSWVDYYGWSWVSHDPWGWAPYHYGRWYNGPRGWCWWPGAIRSRHYWSPGLVAFVGFGGGGAGVGVGFGNVGWVPLAPFEPYHRWYGRNAYRGVRDRTYAHNNIRVVNNVNITNVYRNARVANGISAVNAQDFAAGRFHRVNNVNSGDVQRANLVRGQLPVTPERSSQRLAEKELGSTPRSSTQGRFFSRRTPANVERVSFDDQRRGVEEMSRRTLSNGQGGVNAQSGAPGSGQAPGRTAGPQGAPEGGRNAGDNRGFRRAEQQPSQAQPSQQSAAPVTPGLQQRNDNNPNGWRRFGQPRDGASPAVDAGSGATGGRTRSNRPEPGAAGPVSTPGNSNPGNAGQGNSGSWRRFGDPGGERPARSAPQTSSPPAQSAPRYESPRSAPREIQRSEPQRSSPPPQAAPRSEPQRAAPPAQPASPPREGRRNNDRSGSEPLRFSPPIVRERGQQRQNYTTQTMERPSHSGRSVSYGGSSAPQQSRQSGGGGGRSQGGGSSRNSGGNRR